VYNFYKEEPGAFILWKHNDRSLDEVNRNLHPRFTINKGPFLTTSIVVSNLTLSDNGYYECLVYYLHKYKFLKFYATSAISHLKVEGTRNSIHSL